MTDTRTRARVIEAPSMCHGDALVMRTATHSEPHPHAVRFATAHTVVGFTRAAPAASASSGSSRRWRLRVSSVLDSRDVARKVAHGETTAEATASDMRPRHRVKYVRFTTTPTGRDSASRSHGGRLPRTSATVGGVSNQCSRPSRDSVPLVVHSVLPPTPPAVNSVQGYALAAHGSLRGGVAPW